MKTITKKFIFSVAFIAACASFETANAGYLGENLKIQPTSASSAPALAVAPVADVPIMIIRFNQPHVYFAEPLKKVVSEVKSAKSSAVYEVRSVLPIAMPKSELKKSETKFLSVVSELNKLGVSTTQISSNITYSDAVQNQEVQIFVK